MKLKYILKDLNIEDVYLFDEDIEIHDISSDSKDKNCNLFICVSGEKFDSHNIMSKLKKNVDVFIVEKINKKIQKCQIKLENTRKNMLKIYLNFNNIDINKIKMIGVTGTNGKTTTTYYIKYLLKKLGKNVAVLGTNGCVICDKELHSSLTTPTQKEFVNLLKLMIDNNVEYLIMEVSAHSVKQYRLDGLNFAVGAFTNLTMDHMDDFSSVYEYAYYKFLFLTNCCNRVINIDDKYGLQFAKPKDITISCKNKSSCFYYSFKNDKLILNYENSKYLIKCNIKTDYNAINLTIALSVVYLLGLDIQLVFEYLNTMPEVDGRYNLLNFGDILICIDYAHTPDAIEKVLSNLKSKDRDLIVVFGASGFRDSVKRKYMGKIASKYADYIILTADNPRYENVMQINAQIAENITKPYVCIENRYFAIKHAHDIAKNNSIIAILGKGNEDSQDICAYDVEYNDQKTVYKIFGKERNI